VKINLAGRAMRRLYIPFTGVEMLKKIFLFLGVLSMLTSLLAACGGRSADVDSADLLKGLVNKSRQLVNQPGWVHVTEKIVFDTDKADRGTMPNGQTIPLVQTVDIWYHVNDSKLVYQYVWMMSAQNGEVVEVSVFLNNLLYNLTTNMSNPLTPYRLALDYQFANEMPLYLPWISRLPRRARPKITRSRSLPLAPSPPLTQPPDCC
jgi:hypothetical protein